MNVQLETKIWGTVRHAFSSRHCAVSVLHVDRGYCSRHLHRERVNRFLVVTGSIEVVRYDAAGAVEVSRERLGAGDMTDVPAGHYHRFEVVEPGIVVEVYSPATDACEVRLDDIKRLDVGGRF